MTDSAEILFVPYSTWGHVAPMLAVAAELTRRGIPVRMIVGARYRETVTRARVTAVTPDRDHDVRVPADYGPRAWIERGRLRGQRHLAWKSTARSIHGELGERPPELSVIDPHFGWAHRLAYRHGVPVVPFWTTYPQLLSSRGSAIANVLPELWHGRRFHGDVVPVGPLVCDSPIEGAATAELPSSGPLMVVSPGSVFARSAEFFLGVAAAFADTEWTVVLATTHLPVEALGPLPPNVVGLRWIRQWDLVRHADVLLTHAGISSVNEAISAGTPMILAPRSHEQRRTAAQLCTLGVAEMMGDSPETLREQGDRLLTDSWARRNLDMMRVRAATRGARLAADLLSDAARRSRL